MRKKEKTPQIVRNLAEFLNARGFGANEPRYWARCFYKYTDCGPWAAFLVLEKEASLRCVTFAIGRNKAGKLAIVHEMEDFGERDRLEPNDLRAFGADEDRTIPRSLARSLKEYRRKAEKFAEDTRHTGYKGITVHYGEPISGHRDRRRIWISFSQDIPAKIKNIYYEDIGRNVTRPEETPCECRLKAAGPHPNDPQEETYEAGEPKPNCLQCRGKGTYTKYVPTGEKVEVDPEKCIGIQFGSIVEGSEANFGPVDHMFPFDMADFDRDIEIMEKETSFYWERDNSSWYHVQNTKTEDQYAFHQTWDGTVWDSDKPRSPKLKKAIEDFLKGLNDELNKNGSRPIDYEWHDLPLKGWQIREYINDDTF